MTYPNPFRDWGDWGPRRALDPLAWLWSSTTSTATTIVAGPAGAYRIILNKLAERLVGRRIKIKTDSGEIALTVTKFETDFDMAGLSVGQINEVRMDVTDISWQGVRFDRASVLVHNVHMKPSNPPKLVAAPIDIEAETNAEGLAELIRAAAPKVDSDVDQNAVATVQLSARPRLGHIEVDAQTDGATLAVWARAVVVGRARIRLPRRTPAYRLPLPEMPGKLELTSVDFGPGSVQLTGRLPEWQLSMPPSRVDEVMRQLSTVGKVLTLRWLS